jgi:hypothetical protein
MLESFSGTLINSINLDDRGSRRDPAVIDACLRLFSEKAFDFEQGEGQG